MISVSVGFQTHVANCKEDGAKCDEVRRVRGVVYCMGDVARTHIAKLREYCQLKCVILLSAPVLGGESHGPIDV